MTFLKPMADGPSFLYKKPYRSQQNRLVITQTAKLAAISRQLVE